MPREQRPGAAPWTRRLALIALVGPSATARAHSELRRSVPAAGAVLAAPPDRIELHFNERVQVTALRLRRADGTELALPGGRRPLREAQVEAIPLPPLDPGEYRAEWRAISADGHPIGGTIPFRVAPSAGGAPR